MDFILNDHKCGYYLTSKIADEIGVERRIHYRFNGVEEGDGCVAVVRHPYEIITSGYNYHKMTDEEGWAITPGGNLYDGTGYYAEDGKVSRNIPYQQILKGLPVDDGLEYEMRYVGKLTIDAMYYWEHWDDVEVLYYEDLINDFDTTVLWVLDYFGLDEKLLEKVQYLKLIDRSNKHVTNKDGVPFMYKAMWKDRHYKVAEEIFSKDLLERFGYER